MFCWFCWFDMGIVYWGPHEQQAGKLMLMFAIYCWDIVYDMRRCCLFGAADCISCLDAAVYILYTLLGVCGWVHGWAVWCCCLHHVWRQCAADLIPVLVKEVAACVCLVLEHRCWALVCMISWLLLEIQSCWRNGAVWWAGLPPALVCKGCQLPGGGTAAMPEE